MAPNQLLANRNLLSNAELCVRATHIRFWVVAAGWSTNHHHHHAWNRYRVCVGAEVHTFLFWFSVLSSKRAFRLPELIPLISVLCLIVLGRQSPRPLHYIRLPMRFYVGIPSRRNIFGMILLSFPIQFLINSVFPSINLNNCFTVQGCSRA